MPSVSASALYAAMPDDELVPTSKMKKLVPNDYNVQATMKLLEDMKAIKKILGINLERYVERY